MRSVLCCATYLPQVGHNIRKTSFHIIISWQLDLNFYPLPDLLSFFSMADTGKGKEEYIPRPPGTMIYRAGGSIWKVRRRRPKLLLMVVPSDVEADSAGSDDNGNDEAEIEDDSD